MHTTAGTAPPPGRASSRGHGYSGYTGGCRCSECREAKAAYMRNKRLDAAAARNQTAPGDRYVAAGITHGTISGYKDSSCRCTECSNAKYLQDRRLFVAQRGGISSGVALIITMLGLAVFGFLNEVGRPNGLTLLALLILAGILWALAATARGYRVLDRRDIAYTDKQLKKTKNTTPAAGPDQLVHLLADLLRLATGQREGAQR